MGPNGDRGFVKDLRTRFSMKEIPSRDVVMCLTTSLGTSLVKHTFTSDTAEQTGGLTDQARTPWCDLEFPAAPGHFAATVALLLGLPGEEWMDHGCFGRSRASTASSTDDRGFPISRHCISISFDFYIPSL